MNGIGPLDQTRLPRGIRSRFVPGVNGLTVHVLEAGFEEPGRPCLLLLHGFPELAWSWRKVMVPLAAAGYHVIAPDQRGYGRTTGWRAGFDADLAPFAMPNLVRDAAALVAALGLSSVAAVVGHDFGSPVAAWCALLRPDVFRAVALMSAPFAGPPGGLFDSQTIPPFAREPSIHDRLAALPRPRKHYQWYFSTRAADDDMRRCAEGAPAFLRAYDHHKSADWPGNRPFPLAGRTAEELAKLPTYYVMDLDRTMPQTVAPEMPDAAAIAACGWQTEAELAVYAAEFERTGFQGGLNWYRCRTGGAFDAALARFSGRRIDVPACFVAGASDWGVHQSPGALDAMCTTACTRWRGVHLIDGAGHWVQQERPQAVVDRLLAFLREV